MRLSVALLRDPEAERRAKERAEAPTVKTEEQHKIDEALKEKSKNNSASSSSSSSSPSSSSKSASKKFQVKFDSVWKRRFRPLPEAKAVDLFADVIGDTFILGVACALITYESWKALQKPDVNKQRMDDLSERVEAIRRREAELSEAEEAQRQRFEKLEAALRELKDPRTKKPLLPTLQP